MIWHTLSEDEQLDLLALYITGKLTAEKRQELARAALDDADLFAALGDLTPLKMQLADRDQVRAVLAEHGSWPVRLSLWRERLGEWTPLHLTPRAYVWAASLAACFIVAIFVLWRANPRTCPLDLDGGPPVFLSQCDQLAIRMTDPQVDSNRASTGQQQSQCTVGIKGESTLFPGRLRNNHIEVAIPASALRQASSRILIVRCGDVIMREESLEDRIQK